MRWIAISRGMPIPVLQKEVRTSRGPVFTDVAWRFRRNGTRMWLHVEFDGAGKYRADPGDSVVRVYWDEIAEEGWVFTKITQQIAREVVNGYRPVPALYRPPGR